MYRSLSGSIALVAFLVAMPTGAHEETPSHLLGRCTSEQLSEEPYAEWYREGFDNHEPNTAVLDELRRASVGESTFTIFFGTWCGDSRRQVPRMLRLFDTMGIPEERVVLIGVDRTPEALKRSPTGEEAGREIYRVPTLIVERGGKEIGRLIEHPVLSLERDLLAILSGDDYRPSYPVYATIREWLSEGLLADPNVDPWGLASLIRSDVGREGDLAAAARVLQSRGELAEAIKLFQVNCALFWESAGTHHRLADALLENGETEKARQSATRALRYNDDPERLEELTEILATAGK